MLRDWAWWPARGALRYFHCHFSAACKGQPPGLLSALSRGWRGSSNHREREGVREIHQVFRTAARAEGRLGLGVATLRGAATLGGGGKGSLLHRDSVQATPGPLQLEDQSDHLTSEAWDFQTPGPPEEKRRPSRSHLQKTARGPESANHHQLWDATMRPFPPHNLPGACRIPRQPLHAAARCPAPRCSGDRARGLGV